MLKACIWAAPDGCQVHSSVDDGLAQVETTTGLGNGAAVNSCSRKTYTGFRNVHRFQGPSAVTLVCCGTISAPCKFTWCSHEPEPSRSDPVRILAAPYAG